MKVTAMLPRSLLGAWLWKREFIKAPAFSCFSCCLWHMGGCNFTGSQRLPPTRCQYILSKEILQLWSYWNPVFFPFSCLRETGKSHSLWNQPVTSLRLAVTKVIQLMTLGRAGVGDSDKHLGWGSRRTNLSLGFCYSGLCWFPENCKTLETNG